MRDLRERGFAIAGETVSNFLRATLSLGMQVCCSLHFTTHIYIYISHLSSSTFVSSRVHNGFLNVKNDKVRAEGQNFPIYFLGQ